MRGLDTNSNEDDYYYGATYMDEGYAPARQRRTAEWSFPKDILETPLEKRFGTT